MVMLEDARTVTLLEEATSPSLWIDYPVVTASNKIDVGKTQGKKLRDVGRGLAHTACPFCAKLLRHNGLCTVRSKAWRGQDWKLGVA